MPIPDANIMDLNPKYYVFAYEPDAGTSFISYPNAANNPPYFDGTEYNKSTKRFILLERKFRSEFVKYKEYFKDKDIQNVKAKFSYSLNYLLELDPDIISIELTTEQSVLYTIKKGNYIFFLQHFLNDVDYDEDETILSIYKGDKKLPSYAGDLERSIKEVMLFSQM